MNDREIEQSFPLQEKIEKTLNALGKNALRSTTKNRDSKMCSKAKTATP